MSNINVNGVEIKLDEDGFMEDPDQWNEDVARALAKHEEVEELTEAHWELIKYLRNYFAEFGIAPMVRKLTKETGLKLNEVYELFPTGPAKGACKCAGLPKPTGCV